MDDKKGRVLRGYLMFFLILGISLIFLAPNFWGYATGKDWLGIEVRSKTKIDFTNHHTYNQNNIAFVTPVNHFEIQIKSGTPAGIYMFVREAVMTILLFYCLWCFIKFMIGMANDDKLNEKTANWILKLGKALIIMGTIILVTKALFNFIFLRQLGFAEYKVNEHWGGYFVAGFVLMAFVKVCAEGYELQQENELTV